MDIQDGIKKEIGFGTPMVCDTCAYCSKHEEDVNGPVILTCNYAGAITFKVDEDDFCQKWEER